MNNRDNHVSCLFSLLHVHIFLVYHISIISNTSFDDCTFLGISLKMLAMIDVQL